MALKFKLKTSFGIELQDAYAKILDYTGNKDMLTYRVLVYANEQARNDLADTVYSFTYETVPPTENILPSLYAHLKTFELFANAEDC